MRSEQEIVDIAEFDRLDREERARARRAVMRDAREATGYKMRARRHGPHGPHRMRGSDERVDVKGALLKLMRFMGRFKWALVCVLVFAIASTLFSIVGPKILSEATTLLFDGVVAKVDGTGTIDFAAIARVLMVCLGLYGVSAACAWVQGWVMSYVSQQTCFELRGAIARKIDRLPFGYFDKVSTGDVLSRITNDVDTLGQSLNQGLTQLITSVVTVIGVLVMMVSINWIMALVTLIIVPLSLVFVTIIVKRSQKYFMAQQALLGAVNAEVEETFSGHALVAAFGQEDETCAVYEEANDALCEAAWKSQFLSGLMQPIMNLIGNLGYVIVAIVGAIFAARGIITVGDIQAFIQYVKNFTQPLTQLAQVSNVLQQMAAAVTRIFEVLDAPEIEDAPPSKLPSDLSCDVEFDHVRFGYHADDPIIHDFTCAISSGQRVAIVGPTGSGKTTLVKLLMRFYDVDGGSIRIGGTDIQDIERAQVRELFAMVLQDAWLFSGSIRENIRYGCLSASDAEVEEAARRARADHFIQTLPGGYDFQINESASNISAGQRQLITIARAFLANRRMLILDEATSSVDTRTEAQIQEAMDELAADKTSFIIAHRLSTIKNADIILVIDHGDIVEQGSHDELLRLGGFYATLYNSQFEACKDEIE